jgi:hypothetical protein
MPIPAALAIPLISSGANLLSSAIKKGQANRLLPPETDPQLSALLEDIRREKQSVQSGYDPITMLNKQFISQRGAEALKAATRVSGGDSVGAIEAINKINRSTGRNISEMALGQAGRAGLYSDRMSELIRNMSERKLQLQLLQYRSALGQSNLREQAGTSGLNVLAAKIAGGDPAYTDWLKNIFAKKSQDGVYPTPPVVTSGGTTIGTDTPINFNNLFGLTQPISFPGADV